MIKFVKNFEELQNETSFSQILHQHCAGRLASLNSVLCIFSVTVS